MTDKEVIQMALVQMGINQYSVAELAPHKVVMAFNSAMEVLRAQLEQPDQEPTCPECKAAVLYECVACSSNNYPPAAQPEQEPVAWIQPDHLQKARRAPFLCRVEPTKRMSDFVPLYTTPPAAQRKPLTEEEIWEIHDRCIPPTEGYVSPVDFARAIEAAHGIGEKP